jgi:hypothetical protein
LLSGVKVMTSRRWGLTPALTEVASMAMSDSYWASHLELEARGQIRHPAEECPLRQGRYVRMWTTAGWVEKWAPGPSSTAAPKTATER